MHRTLSRRQVFQLGVPLPLVLAGCAADDDAPSDEGKTRQRQVELFSWWIAHSEADALQALIDIHTGAYPDEEVYNAAVDSGAEAKTILAERIAKNRPPDIYQENAYNIGTFLEMNPNGLISLSDFFVEEGLLDVVVPEVIADVTFNGEISAMPVNIHRENALLYNKKIFADLELEVPTTLEELFSVCQVLRDNGIVPIAASHQDWILRIIFNALASASMGPAAYKSYFNGETELDEAALRTAIGLFDDVLTNYINDTASNPEFGWTDAADLLLSGDAAMFIHGDWAKGYLAALGWAPGKAFGVVGMPGASDFFLYGVDVFALVAGGPQPEAAKDFLRTVASKEGQTAFNKIKGSSPIRLDIDPDELDEVGRATLEDLRSASLRMLTRSKSVWDEALAAFAVDHDADALLAAYVDNPPSQ